jgi:hypothetical protein
MLPYLRVAITKLRFLYLYLTFFNSALAFIVGMTFKWHKMRYIPIKLYLRFTQNLRTMKKTTLSTSMALLGAVCIALTLSSFTKSNTSNKRAIMERPNGVQPGEDILSLSGDIMQPTTAYTNFALKNSSLYYYNGSTLTTIDSLQNKMDTAYLRNIYDSAAKRAHGTNYVTVLQVKYGFHTNKVVLYYKGICLTRDTYNSTTKIGTYSNHNKFDSNYYTCSPTGFVRAPYKNQFLVDSASYVSTMQIRHHVGALVVFIL